MRIGISAIAYALPEMRESLDELNKSGRLDSEVETLRSFGFEWACVASETAPELASRALGQLMRNHAIEPESISALFYAGAIPPSHSVANHAGAFLDQFNYPASKLQYDFGLTRASVFGVGQVGCLGMISAIHLAMNYLMSHADARRAVCVSADAFPPGAGREIMYNVISDGACALIVEKNATGNVILAHRQITKGYYWDCTERKNEIVAAYFPTAQNIVKETLACAGQGITDIALVIPHNVSLRSWEILLGLLGFSKDKLYFKNIARTGHIIAADNFMNLKDATDEGLLKSGDKILLFNFGFGANWSCLILEH